MPETLFRGKKQVMSLNPQKIITDGWAYGYYVHAITKKNFKETWCDMIISANNFDLRWIIDARTLGQFTGLYDCTKWKNLSEKERQERLKYHTADEWKGKPIFEGDIVKHYNHHSSDRFDIGVVFWEEKRARFLRTSNGNAKEISLCDSASLCGSAVYEVIGNIYDNPELLGGE